MIDTHCHLEQKDYDGKRDALIAKCIASGLKAVVTCCARPQDFALTMDIAGKHPNFVFPVAGIHPEFIKEVTPEETETFLEIIKRNRDRIVGIGETGLDYNWIKETEWRKKQKELFIRMIRFAKRLKKPLVIHARNSPGAEGMDAYEDSINILEQEGAKCVQLHMFGASQLVQKVIDNDWHVSLNAIVLRSKKHKKIARDMPSDRLMLETDAPWLAPEGWESKTNDPRAIITVAEKIAKIRKTAFEELWQQCGRNAKEFFVLPVKI